jgi:glutamate/tyrosine decarboxylase-like PLP-dependent enzyme
MTIRSLLQRAAGHAADHLDGLDDRPVGATASLTTLRARLDGPLPEAGLPPERVLDELVRDVDGGLLGCAGGRFFGWAIGGSVPAALAADWLTAAWDQNAALYACGPAVAVIEEVCATWLKALLGLPPGASVALVTGTQMAHVTALAAARNHLLAERGWDVERRGLAGAPAPRVVVTGERHGSIDRAVRLLGLGADAIVETDDLERALEEDREAPTVVVLKAGDLNRGAFDDFPAACDLARETGAWVHVDGAFGLWAAASERHRHLVRGVERADSWTTDGHKWLNVPYDTGFAFTAHPEAHRNAMSFRASYLTHADDSARDQIDWNPEWSRRARAVPVYAAIRSLGRAGIADLVDRCCAHAARLVAGIGALPGAEVLAEPRINQGLVRFGDDDRRTDEVIERVQAGGETWFGGTTWNGVRAMRVSVLNWQTSDEDVERAIAAVREAVTPA